MRRSVSLIGMALLVLSACSGASRGSGPLAAEATVLKAALFPYIPDSAKDDFKSLIAALERGFEASQPGVDLQLTIDPEMNLYDYEPGGMLSQLLGSGNQAMQVVEIDTVLLGKLVDNGWVQPLGLPDPGVVPAAWQASSIGGVAYGAPTYLCTNVIYSMSSNLSSAQNGMNLVSLLSGMNPKATPLVGDYKGSWTLPSTYVDAWGDSNSSADLSTSFKLPLDQKTMELFAPVVKSCASGTTNPCLDGTYDRAGAETAFASGAANGFFGYTERLFYILDAAPGRPLPQVISAPIGDGSNPVLFVDSLVFNPGCQGACLAAAQAFASYMSKVEVRNLIAFSQDAPAGTPPRYLLPASTAFYTSSPARSDSMYQAYKPIIDVATAYPNIGFPDARGQLADALKQVLTNP